MRRCGGVFNVDELLAPDDPVAALVATGLTEGDAAELVAFARQLRARATARAQPPAPPAPS